MHKYFGFIGRVGPKVIKNYHWISKYAKHPEKFDSKMRYQRVHEFISNCCSSLKCEFFVEGLENIPDDTNVLFTPNHQSNMDALTLLSNIEKPIAFVAKKESEKFPIVGKVIKAIDGKFMDRSSLKKEVRIMMAVSKALEERPFQNEIIFPEGTRSKDLVNREMGEFKAGALKPAYNSHKPIVPIVLFGTFRVLDKSQPNMKKFPIQMKVLEPIYYEEYSKYSTVNFAKILEEKMRKELDVLRQKDKELFFKYSYKYDQKKMLKEKKENISK